VSSIPVEKHESIKRQLGLENAVHKLAILASVCAVNAVVRAHDRGDTSSDAVDKGPEVVLVQSLVVDVGGNSLDSEVRTSESLLFIGDKMLQE
jgi:hypothetical protein